MKSEPILLPTGQKSLIKLRVSSEKNGSVSME